MAEEEQGPRKNLCLFDNLCGANVNYNRKSLSSVGEKFVALNAAWYGT